MSQIIHTYDKNKNKRVTIANVFSSTPTKSIIKHGNISLSEIDTGSSSSGGKITRNVRFQLRDLANKHERHLKKKKRSDIKRIVKNSDSKCEAKRTELINQSLNEERKKNLKNKKESVKKKLIVTQTKDKDSEWETESEKSVNELSIRSLSTSKDDERMKLFEDPCTPEKIRDTPKTYEEILLESPIIGSFRRRSCLVSKKNDIILQNELFPMNWLPSKIRNLDETIEDETLFDYEGNKKAHVSLQKPEIKSKQTSKNVSFSDLQSPTITFRRDWPIKTYSRKTTPHLTLSFELSPIKLMSFRPRLPKKTKNTPILPVMDSSSQEEFKNDKLKTKTSKRNMRNQKKKIKKPHQKTKTNRAVQSTLKQKYDIYDIYDEIDTEFENGGQDGKRISFREFCQRKDVKQNHKTSPLDIDISKYNTSSSDSIF